MIKAFLYFSFAASFLLMSNSNSYAQPEPEPVYLIDGLEYNFDSIVNQRDTSNKFYADLLSPYKQEDCRVIDGTEEYCASFDATGSVDNYNPDLEFIWRFDRTLVQKGKVVRQCFDRPGYHRVKLRTVDPVTGVGGVNQDTLFKIYIPPELSFHVSGDTSIMSTLTFDAGIYARKYPDLVYVWDFGEELKRSGTYLRYVYREQGMQRATLWVFDNVMGEPELKGCIYKDINVSMNVE